MEQYTGQYGPPYQMMAPQVMQQVMQPMQIGPKPGIFVAAWRRLFGEPDAARNAIKQATNHGAFMLKLGQFLSPVLMVAFSLGALLTLAKGAIIQIAAALTSGQAPDPVAIITTAVTFLLVFGMDVAMVVAAIGIRHAREAGSKWHESLFNWFIIIVVSAIESITFIVMVSGYEHPQTVWDWAYISSRAAVVPIVAVFLATREKRPPNRGDFMRILQMNAGTFVANYLQRGLALGDAELDHVFEIFALATGFDPSQREWMHELMGALRNLTPGAAQAQTEAAIRAAQDEAQTAIASAEARTRELVTRALLHLSSGAPLPDEVLQIAPELAGLNFAGSGRKGRSAEQKPPATRAEAARQFLASQGIDVVKTPERRKGVWVKGTQAIPALTDKQITGDPAADLAQRLGDQLRTGRSYICPIERLMPELAARHSLTEAAAAWWDSLQVSGLKDEDDQAGSLAPIGRASRSDQAPSLHLVG